MEIRKEIHVHRTKEELFQFIEETHRKYREKKSIVLEDCRYIVRVCMEVVVSIVAILQNSFVEMKAMLAEPVL